MGRCIVKYCSVWLQLVSSRSRFWWQYSALDGGDDYTENFIGIEIGHCTAVINNSNNSDIDYSLMFAAVPYSHLSHYTCVRPRTHVQPK